MHAAHSSRHGRRSSAKSRTNPTRAARPVGGGGAGRPAQQEFEYRRHGTVALFAAFETRQLLDTAEFSHTSDLAGAILDYIDDYNNRAQPFKWTYQATHNSHTTYAREH